MPRDPERSYAELLFASSGKYAAWDPEVPVRVGDWGFITRGTRPRWFAFWTRGRRHGSFLKRGNIYDDGLAERFNVPSPRTHEHEGSAGISWIVSQNAKEVDTGGDVSVESPTLVGCNFKASYKFHSGRGAVLCMDGDTISTIDPPGALCALLRDTKLPKKAVIVSEVHATSSYARYLGTPEVRQVSIGLRLASPTVASTPGVGVSARWLKSSTAGNFKSKINADGVRTYYPLFRLVALEGNEVSNGMMLLSDETLSRRKAPSSMGGALWHKFRKPSSSPASEGNGIPC